MFHQQIIFTQKYFIQSFNEQKSVLLEIEDIMNLTRVCNEKFNQTQRSNLSQRLKLLSSAKRNIGKNLNVKYREKLLDSAKKSTSDLL